MVRGIGGTAAIFASVLLALGCASGGKALAADLDSSCCADLEERVAELEATTARKGNRVVSLQISGTVHESLLIWDDGEQSDAYIVGNTSSQSLIDIKGEGRISPEVTAGFFIELGAFSEASFLVDQTSDEALIADFSDKIFIRHNALYIDHAKLGRIWLGQTSGATDSITEINLAKSVIVRSAGAQIFNGFFKPRREDGTLADHRFFQLWGGDTTQGPGEGHRYDLVKYESAALAGFKLSASWGENDFFDVALRYSGLVFQRVKLAAGIGFGSFTDVANNGCRTDANGEADCHQLGMSFGAMDVPTGLFVHVAYGIKNDEVIDGTTQLGIDNADGTDSMFYVQAGIEKNWFGYGATTLFAEYERFDSGFRITQGPVGPAPGTFFTGAETRIWGIGINQNFESAALDLYVSYRHIDSEADSGTFAATVSDVVRENYQGFDEVYAGARIKF